MKEYIQIYICFNIHLLTRVNDVLPGINIAISIDNDIEDNYVKIFLGQGIPCSIYDEGWSKPMIFERLERLLNLKCFM